MKVLITGGTGFIGHHLVTTLKRRGAWVRVADVRPPRWGPALADEYDICDLRQHVNAYRVMQDIDWVFALAADMGGAGYVFTGKNDLDIMVGNTRINLNTLDAASNAGIKRYLFSSSACVYPEYLQEASNIKSLVESKAYPAAPDSEYGWEKLYAERLCSVYEQHSDMQIRIARFHNVYGPEGSWCDGREKVPAAMCRKVAVAKLTGNPEVVIWGDGEQTRSFMYIDDCTEGLIRLMLSNYSQPVNLGRDRMVTINELVDVITKIAGIDILKTYVEGPQGVRGRNSNNDLCKQVLKDWEPQIPLEEGLIPTYNWIEGKAREWLKTSSS